jgi:hypothetical protein
MRFLFGFFTIALTISLSSPVLAYKEIPVSNGGTISGKVVLTGEEPPPLAFSLVINNNTEFCGRISTGTGWRLVDEFHVAPDGGLQNAVVFLEGIHQGKPFPETQPAQVVVEDCLFSPWLLVVRDSQPIHIKNMDPIIHDVQLYETAPFGAKVMLHRPLRLNPFHPKDLLKDHLHKPGETMMDTLQFTQGRRTFFLECGFHAYMQTWGLAVTNPYYAVTDEQGNFTLPDIPEGVYKMVAWHPGMAGFLDMKVVVLSNDTMKVRMEFPEPRDRRMAHTTMSPSYRFDTRALEREGAVIDIQVTHEDQGHQGKP